MSVSTPAIRRGSLLVGLLAHSILAHTHLASAPQTPIRDPIQVLSDYRALVEAYRRNGADSVATDLRTWGGARFDNAISLLSLARRSNPLVLDTTNGRADLAGWNMPLVGAAALLHTDLFLSAARDGLRNPQNLDFATRLLTLYTGAAADREFQLHLTLVIAWMRQITGDFQTLRRQLFSAHQEFPNEPAIAMAEGCLEEASASPRAIRQPFIRAGLGRAEASYRRALLLDPQLAEARARLGYVLFRLGRVKEALAELQQAQADVRDAHVAYLAALFLGAVHEQTGRLPDAIVAYRGARDIRPTCPVALLALSHAFYRAGDRAAATAIAREAGATDLDACEDPWWSYDYGQARKIDETMRGLRRKVHP